MGDHEMMMVLNDGETYTTLKGCAIVAVPDSVADEDTDFFIKAAMEERSMESDCIVTKFK